MTEIGAAEMSRRSRIKRFAAFLLAFLIFTSILNIVTASASLAGFWANFTVKGFLIDISIGSVLGYFLILRTAKEKGTDARTA